MRGDPLNVPALLRDRAAIGDIAHVGGLAVSLLLAEGFGWPVIFIIGGVFPLILVAITALWLPEAPRFLAAQANLPPHHRTLLQRLGNATDETHAVDVARRNPISTR
jgi:MFS family permease